MEREWREEELGFRSLVRRFIDGSFTLGFFSVLGILVGAAYLVFSEPQYTAESTLLLTTATNRTQNVDSLHVELETHARLIGSDTVIAEVLRRFDTADAETFVPGSSLALRIIDSARMQFSLPPLSGSDTFAQRDLNADGSALSDLGNDPILASIPVVRKNLTTGRVSQSMLLRVSYKSSDPAQAVRVTNAFVEVYTRSKWAETGFAMPVEVENVRPELIDNVAMEVDLAEEKFPSGQRTFDVVSPATLQTSKRTPEINVVLAVFAMIGFLAGVALIIRREWKRAA